MLEGCAFLGCRLERARLSFATLRDCKTTGTTFLRCELRPLTVEGGDWSCAACAAPTCAASALAGVRLAEADLVRRRPARAATCPAPTSSTPGCAGCELGGADLRGADLSGCEVDRVDWAGVRIDVETAVLLARSRGAEVG